MIIKSVRTGTYIHYTSAHCIVTIIQFNQIFSDSVPCAAVVRPRPSDRFRNFEDKFDFLIVSHPTPTSIPTQLFRRSEHSLKSWMECSKCTLGGPADPDKITKFRFSRRIQLCNCFIRHHQHQLSLKSPVLSCALFSRAEDYIYSLEGNNQRLKCMYSNIFILL